MRWRWLWSGPPASRDAVGAHDRTVTCSSEPVQRVLVGGTASGKKAVAAALFERHGLPLLSMDSMKVYRGMDIGTDKPDTELRRRAPFALLDLVGHDEAFSVGRWAAAARAEVLEARAPTGAGSGHVGAARPGGARSVLFAGGTPLYLRALLRGLCPSPPIQVALRAELLALWEREGEAYVRAELERADPGSTKKLLPGDAKRLLRALEVLRVTGQSLSVWQREQTAPVIPGRIVVAALRRTPADAAQRQARRAAQMLDHGLIAEVDALASLAPFAVEPARAIGYAEVLAWRGGSLKERDVLPRIVTRTRQLQRKQRLFLQSFPELRWVEVAPGAALADIVAAVERALEL